MDYHKNTSGGRVVASSNLVIPTTDKALIIARLSMLFAFINLYLMWSS